MSKAGLKKQCYDALMHTLLYSDIFDFPLRKDEFWYFLKSHVKISKNQFLRNLKSLPNSIIESGGYYCLKGRSNIISQHINRKENNKNKFLIARKIASILSIIPTVNLIGISGSLASKNSSKNDDIDFFIITRNNSIWVTRIACIFILEIIRVRRRRSCQKPTDKICLNMFMDEKHLVFPSGRRDIYTAHEIAQLTPLIDKYDTYKRLIDANDWIGMYMPNFANLAFARSRKYIKYHDKSRLMFIISKIFNRFFSSIIANRMIEFVAKTIQTIKISKSKTNETVTESLIAFHPNDYRLRVLRIYKDRVIDQKLYSKLVFANKLWYYFNMQNIKKFLIILLSFAFICLPQLTYAQITPSPAVLPTCMPTQLNPDGCVPTHVEGFVAEYYKYGLGIVGGFAVLMIIFGSYQILISKGNPKTLNDGKTIIAYAIGGLLLAIFGYVFVEVIAKDILKIPGFT